MALKLKEVKDWKRSEVKKIIELIRKYRVVALADLYKVRAAQIQELRKKLRGELVFRCSKSSLLKRALKEVAAEKPNIDRLMESLNRSSACIYTELDAFKLSFLLEKSKIPMPAKAEDIAPRDIVIAEGNTGMPPGPIISEFTELNVPTKIEGGSIWIVEDTVVVEKGKPISAKVASLLSKLGIKPMESGISINIAYENGLIYPQELLRIDLQATKASLQKAVEDAFNLALNLAYPTPETLPILLGRGIQESMNLAAAGVDFGKDTLPLLLGKCHSEAVVLLEKLKEKAPTLAS
ncbi:MAG: 50S ribosomal protein L10 [Candidatus Bathyarchaeia archaeon]